MIVNRKVTNTKRRNGRKKKNITPSSRADNANMRLHTHVSAFLQENLNGQKIRQNYAIKNTTMSSPAAKAHS